MSLTKHAVHGLKWQGIEIAGRQIVAFIVFAILTRLLDQTAFGLLGMVLIYLAIVGLIVEQGIGTAIVQRAQISAEHLDSAFWFNMVSACVLCGATVILAGPIATLFDEPRVEPLLRWGSLRLVLSAPCGVQSALFVKNMDFRLPAIRALVANVAGGAVGIAMAFAGLGVWALVGQQLVFAGAGTAFLWSLSSWRPSLRFSARHLRELLGVSGSIFATSAMWFVASRADQFFIGRYLGTEMLGQYVVGGRLADMGRLAFQQPLGAVSVPAMSKLQGDAERLRRAITSGMQLSSMVTFPIFLGLASIAPTVVPLFFGDGWRDAVQPLRLLAIYNMITSVFTLCHPALLATGGLRGYVVVNLQCAVGAIAVSWIGSQMSVTAIVVGLCVNLAITGYSALLFLKKRVGLTPWMYVKPCVSPLAAAIVMSGGVVLVHELLSARLTLIAMFAIEVATGVGIYGGCILLLARDKAHQLLRMLRTAVGSTKACHGSHNDHD